MHVKAWVDAMEQLRKEGEDIKKRCDEISKEVNKWGKLRTKRHNILAKSKKIVSSN